jgi:hypothetical protein
MKTIFVNIPCYQDPEIWETISSFIDNADNPERIYFGITNQTDNFLLHQEVLERFPNVKMHLLVPGSLPGCQPARLKSHEFYNNEDYYLNMDSHMRAIKKWDTLIIEELDDTDKKYGPSVFTGYVAAYDKDNDNKDKIPNVDYTTVFNMNEQNVNHFIKHGIPQFISFPYVTDEPIPSPYISGHFFFTTGKAVIDSPFVKDILFTEEEIFMAVRFFTAGYNLFQPTRTYVYHRYGRNGRSLFWEDFPEKWYEKSEESKNFVNNVFLNEIVSKENGLLDKRTLLDFEQYSGIDFRNRTLSEDVIKGKIKH